LVEFWVSTTAIERSTIAINEGSVWGLNRDVSRAPGALEEVVGSVSKTSSTGQVSVPFGLSEINAERGLNRNCYWECYWRCNGRGRDVTNSKFVPDTGSNIFAGSVNKGRIVIERNTTIRAPRARDVIDVGDTCGTSSSNSLGQVQSTANWRRWWRNRGWRRR
jgi:hypothetical protein